MYPGDFRVGFLVKSIPRVGSYFIYKSSTGKTKNQKPTVRRKPKKTGYSSVWSPPPPKWAKMWPNNMLGGKKIERVLKNGGKIHIFSPVGKKYAYFSPIDLILKKCYNKGWHIFRLCRAPPIIINSLALNINHVGGRGAKIWISILIYTPVYTPAWQGYFFSYLISVKADGVHFVHKRQGPKIINLKKIHAHLYFLVYILFINPVPV